MRRVGGVTTDGGTLVGVTTTGEETDAYWHDDLHRPWKQAVHRMGGQRSRTAGPRARRQRMAKYIKHSQSLRAIDPKAFSRSHRRDC